jgi:[ribosomal protein S5]-alanine N-acetyltransferase
LDYHLIQVHSDDTHLISTFYAWEKGEPNRQFYTCRPVQPLLPFEDYMDRYRKRLDNNAAIQIYVLVSRDEPLLPYGKVTMFDYNPRNLSAEFGYYLPLEHRGKGLGKLMVRQLLNKAFGHHEWLLNKLYATTASGNTPSIHLLQRLGFSLDGKMREHYWINGQTQDQLWYSILKREWR